MKLELKIKKVNGNINIMFKGDKELEAYMRGNALDAELRTSENWQGLKYYPIRSGEQILSDICNRYYIAVNSFGAEWLYRNGTYNLSFIRSFKIGAEWQEITVNQLLPESIIKSLIQKTREVMEALYNEIYCPINYHVSIDIRKKGGVKQNA